MCFTNKIKKNKPIKTHLKSYGKQLLYTYVCTHTHTHKERGTVKNNPEMQCWLEQCLSYYNGDYVSVTETTSPPMSQFP